MSKIKDELIDQQDQIEDLAWEHSRHSSLERKILKKFCSECHREEKEAFIRRLSYEAPRTRRQDMLEDLTINPNPLG